jgi:hypothetical protein
VLFNPPASALAIFCQSDSARVRHHLRWSAVQQLARGGGRPLAGRVWRRCRWFRNCGRGRDRDHRTRGGIFVRSEDVHVRFCLCVRTGSRRGPSRIINGKGVVADGAGGDANGD